MTIWWPSNSTPLFFMPRIFFLLFCAWQNFTPLLRACLSDTSPEKPLGISTLWINSSYIFKVLTFDVILFVCFSFGLVHHLVFAVILSINIGKVPKARFLILKEVKGERQNEPCFIGQNKRYRKRLYKCRNWGPVLRRWARAARAVRASRQPLC